MGSGHSHALPKNKTETTLWLALGLTTTFLIAEAVAGLLLNSLALLADAAHMLTDAAALAIALAAVRIARRAADSRRSYGYYRFEILAAAFNAVLLFGVAVYIIYEAYQRFRNPVAVQSMGMLVVAVIGLVINLISMRLLSAGKEESLNLKGAYLEVWSDMLGSIGVILAALAIRYTGFLWIDTLVAVAIGLWVLPRTWVLLKESVNILLEGVPEGIDFDEVGRELLAMPGVSSVHDLHIWALTSGKNSLTAHIVTARESDFEAVRKAVQSLLASKFKIFHTTLQVELQACDEFHEGCTYVQRFAAEH